MRKNVNQLKVGVIITYISLLIGNIIPLVYTPIMLNIMGKSEYGLYNLSNSVVGYMSLLSFGLGSTIVKYVTDYISIKDKEGEEKIIGLFIKIYSILFFICIVIGIILSLNVDRIFSKSLTLNELAKMRILVMLMAINTGISFPLSVFSAIIISHQKYIYNKLISLLSTIFVPIANLIVLYMGYASIGIVISTTILNIIFGIINIWYCGEVLQIKPNIKDTDYSILKGMIIFSFFIFLGEVVNMLYWATDKVIIGKYIGTAAVSVYSIGATFNTYLGSFASAIGSVLFPKVNIMVNNDSSREDLSNLFIKVGRLQYLIISLILLGFSIFGKEFIRLWAGLEYSDSYIIALLTMIPVAVPLIQSTGISILQAKNMHKFRSIMFLFIAILNLILSILWVKNMGIVGCAIATCLAYTIGPVIIMNWYYWKKVKLDIVSFWKNILKMTIPYLIISLMYVVFIKKYMILINWTGLFTGIIIYTTMYAVVTWLFVANDYEKDLIGQPLNKIRNKLFKKTIKGV
ncbi:MAG: oligosaccharide flippase family protein [Intestinibacter bartlettii]|uniref:oligosaccharide flippase family protein n=1 Tax=Intestinibacter bartlettii TaxID=261299 RepID=UPI0029035113|nr:oligosaccharide flippase family protein [Intestinibacter bartlettii]MDU2693461.1 oligosaccharide flippase family protein [Intestinibacter bartlettii]